jgi:bifunctional UDP-N-acetylglucosamine pyrophosphorylase / glucosamine-1-phosphate N-acetyltransferase
MPENAAVIIAAGMGTRMRSKIPKVAHKICGKAIVSWVVDSCAEAGIKHIAVVVGVPKDDVIKEIRKDVTYIVQEKQLGTGHAVMAAADFIRNVTGNVFVLCGDAPMLLPETIRKLAGYHEDNGYDATMLTALVESPYGYGRVLRKSDGLADRIVEQKDANEEELTIREINSGDYIFKKDILLAALENINNNNAQNEYYLTDTIKEINRAKGRVGVFSTADSSEISGINDRIQLSQAAATARKRILERHMLNGVTIEDPVSTYIDADAVIGRDVTILSGSRIEGLSIIEDDSLIGPGSRVINSQIGKRTVVDDSVIVDSKVGSDTRIGPFSYIRPDSVIGDSVKIGDYVEIKKSVIGSRTKISHLTYVGDAVVGENCNFGCGVVVVNYDGKTKSQTVIGDNAFIGCNVNLIAPVIIEKDTYIAAGSTINKRVPEKSLAIARCRQTNIENWVERKNMQRK